MYHEADRTSRKPYYEEKMVGKSDEQHVRNFLTCIRSRKSPAAAAEVGHLGAIPSHLANIAYRVGRPIRWNAGEETIIDDAEASKLLTKTYRAPWHV